MRFAHRTLGQRVVLDAGGAVARIRAELDRLEPRAVMVIGSERHAALMDALTGRTALRWTEVAQHVPEPLAERATSAADRAGVDVVVAVGGGSAIGLAKAIALQRPVRIVAVPTTYAGSEATNVWGLTGPGGKRTGSADRVLPDVVVYDPDLVASMPSALAAIDAVTGLLDLREELDAPRALREVGLRAQDLPEAVEAVLPAVPASNPRPVDAAALTRLLRAAWAGDPPGGLA